jgi:hypothetical protein
MSSESASRDQRLQETRDLSFLQDLLEGPSRKWGEKEKSGVQAEWNPLLFDSEPTA